MAELDLCETRAGLVGWWVHVVGRQWVHGFMMVHASSGFFWVDLVFV